MSLRGPELELRVACRPDLQQRVVAAVVEFEAGDRLGVAAVEILRQPEDRGEPPDDLAPFSPELPEIRVPA